MKKTFITLACLSASAMLLTSCLTITTSRSDASSGSVKTMVFKTSPYPTAYVSRDTIKAEESALAEPINECPDSLSGNYVVYKVDNIRDMARFATLCVGVKSVENGIDTTIVQEQTPVKLAFDNLKYSSEMTFTHYFIEKENNVYDEDAEYEVVSGSQIDATIVLQEPSQKTTIEERKQARTITIDGDDMEEYVKKCVAEPCEYAVKVRDGSYSDFVKKNVRGIID